MKPTLLVTNDFPPRAGGIQTFLEGFAKELDAEKLFVFTSTPPDTPAESGKMAAAKYDASVPWRIYRDAATIMLPNPLVAKKMQEIIIEHHIENVWFGAAAPLGLLANVAREAGAKQIIATTHGHEIGWSMLPGARPLLRKIFHDADTVTYLTEATRRRLAPFFGTTPAVQLHGAIDPAAFAFSETARQKLRQRYKIPETAPVVVCISRLVERKGQDTLISIWAQLAEKFPQAYLVIVGKGPYEKHLRELAEHSPRKEKIIFTGEVPYSELADHYSLGDIFAMPCRTRGGGLDIEGLGIVYLEAYAAGLPVVAGDSGGAPEAVQDGKTGIVVNGHSANATAKALEFLLAHPERGRAMGAAGKEWVNSCWTWRDSARPLQELLA